MREGYAVQVLKWGEPILTIEHEMLSGKAECTPDEEQAMRDGSEHLMGFIGNGEPTPCFVCGGVEACRPDCELSHGALVTEEHREDG